MCPPRPAPPQVANGAAVVGLCRMKGKEDINSCKTLVDNDCNGGWSRTAWEGALRNAVVGLWEVDREPGCNGGRAWWTTTATVGAIRGVA